MSNGFNRGRGDFCKPDHMLTDAELADAMQRYLDEDIKDTKANADRFMNLYRLAISRLRDRAGSPVQKTERPPFARKGNEQGQKTAPYRQRREKPYAMTHGPGRITAEQPQAREKPAGGEKESEAAK